MSILTERIQEELREADLFLTRKSSGGHQANQEEKRKKPSARGTGRHSVGTALLQSVAEIGTQSAMKSSRKTLH
jgi:hypothetical protein